MAEPTRKRLLLHWCRRPAPKLKSELSTSNDAVNGDCRADVASVCGGHHAPNFVVLFAAVLSAVAIGSAVFINLESRAYKSDLTQLLESVADAGGLVPTQFQSLRAQRQRWCAGDDFEPPFDRSCTVPLVLYGWNRPEYFSKVLSRLRRINDHVMSLEGWDRNVPALAIIVSLDGPHPGMLQTIAAAEAQGAPIRRVLVHPVASFHPDSRRGVIHLKQHWTWMMGQVFDVLPELRRHDAPVVFIEDDMHLPLESLHVYRWLAGVHARCADCWGGALSVGGFSAGPNPDPYTAIIKEGHTNAGYFFNRTMWEAIADHEAHWDGFTDGWDWALTHFIHIGIWPPRAVVPALSRVHNFGLFGITVTATEYAKLGLGASPYSKGTAQGFLAHVKAAGDAQSEGHGLTVEETPAGEGQLWPGDEGRLAAATIARCPVCQSQGQHD